MDLKAHLISAATAYCEGANISKARLATLVANDGKFFNRIEGGGGFTAEMYERFIRYFHDHPVSAPTDSDKSTPSSEAAA